MKVSKKSLAVVGAAATIGLAGLATLSASAATSPGNSSLIDKLVAKFNLKKEDVQAVFDQDKADRQAEHQAEVSEHLQDLVDKGKITSEQKTLIENKQKELQVAQEKERTDLEAWAEQNKIDARYLMMGHHPGGDDDRLQDLVDDGKITADQKTLIENKQKELETKLDETRSALDKWASDNNIDKKYLMMGFGRGVRMGGPDKHF